MYWQFHGKKSFQGEKKVSVSLTFELQPLMYTSTWIFASRFVWPRRRIRICGLYCILLQLKKGLCVSVSAWSGLPKLENLNGFGVFFNPEWRKNSEIFKLCQPNFQQRVVTQSILVLSNIFPSTVLYYQYSEIKILERKGK